MRDQDCEPCQECTPEQSCCEAHMTAQEIADEKSVRQFEEGYQEGKRR